MCSQQISGWSDGTRPLEVLEREITALACEIHAATCRWLGLVAEYDAREGWAQWGCQSCAHWVAWQCAIAPGAAREHVRVARRLSELPLIRAAFAAGELSYSKVRALTRVENLQREQDLLDLARHATASQLERIVRGYRRRDGRAQPSQAHPSAGSRSITPTRQPAAAWAVAGRGGRARSSAALEAAQDWLREQAATTRAVPRSRRASFPGAPGGSAEPSAAQPEARRRCAGGVADGSLAGDSGGAHRRGPLPGRRARRRAAAVRSRRGGRCELEDGSPLAPQTARRLACDASLVTLLERDGATRADRPQDPHDPARAAARAQRPRPRLPLPRLRPRPWTRTTSNTGPTAAPPTSTTSSTCADTTTACCTKAATRSPAPKPATSASTAATAGRSPPARTPAHAANPASCRKRDGPTPACPSPTTGSTSNSPSTPYSPSPRPPPQNRPESD